MVRAKTTQARRPKTLLIRIDSRSRASPSADDASRPALPGIAYEILVAPRGRISLQDPEGPFVLPRIYLPPGKTLPQKPHGRIRSALRACGIRVPAR